VHRTIEVVLEADDDLRVNLVYDHDAVGHALVALGEGWDDKRRWQNLVRALLIVLRGWDVVENGQKVAINVEELETTPLRYLWRIMWAIIDDSFQRGRDASET
jgi:hypothetical protein